MLSRKLKQLRKDRGLTLEELAEKIGTSRQTIHRYENGTITNIPPEKVEAIAKTLGTTPASLMGWEEDDLYSKFDNIYPVTTKKIPVIGEIACGEPTYAVEEHESYVTVGSDVDADFCLRAKGDSMIGSRIQNGDIVYIKSQSSVDNGQIAAVIIGDEATLKRIYYYPNEGKLLLMPDNPRYAPLVYEKEALNEIKIIGRAVAFKSVII